MKNMRVNDDTEKRNALAEIIAAIPIQVYYAFFTLCCTLVISEIVARLFPNTGLSTFVSGFNFWLIFIIVVLAVIIFIRLLHAAYCLYHDVVMKHKDRKTASLKMRNLELKNNLLAAKVNAANMLPEIITYAISQGSNVKYEGLEVSSQWSNVHTLGTSQQPQALLASPDYLPEPYKLSDILQNWQPTKDGILLAKKQELITSPIGEGLCHTTFTGNTDAGKTNNERSLLIQLLFLEQIVYLCDRNYQRYREDKKQGCYYDYQPIANLLKHEPIDQAKQALALLKFLYAELEDRRARRKHNLVKFPDIYMVWDELPAFCGDEPEIMKYVGRFLRESRQYGIFFIGAAQDLLNNTLHNDNGAIRDNLLTNYYGGGDMNTARQVLAIPKGETIDETGLGIKGITYLRAKGAGVERVKARAALSDDLATQLLLADRVPVHTRVNLPTEYQATTDTALHTQHTTDLVPIKPTSSKATLSDAIAVWNECGGNIGRKKMFDELTARGLACTDDSVRTMLASIKERLQVQ